jgi:dipeptidyl aminopeptidase/acylaminoacyl peptidase
VLCHGYTGVKDLYLPDNARVLNEAGYVVMTFDYKGWGDSEGSRSRLAPYSRVADVQAALMLLGTVPEVDAERLGIYGTSYGGATVVWTGAVDSRVKCVVSVVGIGDGARWMRGVRRPDEFHDLLQRAAQDRKQRALDGKSEFVKREEILLSEGVGDIKPLLGQGPAFPQRG